MLVMQGCSESKAPSPGIQLTRENVNSFLVEQKKQLREDEENAQAHYQLSRAYLMKGEHDSADRHARISTRLDPLNPDYYEQLGSVAFARQRFHEALTELGTAVKIDPDRVSAYLKLARTYEQVGDTTRAIAVLEETLHKDRYYSEALYYLARLHLRQHEYSNALRVLEELLKLDPNNRDAQLLRIQTYSTQGSYFYAQTLVEEMIEQWPDYPPLRHELLRILFTQQKWDEVTQAIQSMDSGNETSVEILLIRAYMEFNRGNSRTGEKNLLHILDIDPRNMDALLGLSSLELRKGNLAQALHWLNRAAEINTRLGNVQFLRATVLYRQGDYLQGDLALKRALASDPENSSFQLLSLRRRLMEGELTVVEEELRRLQERHPLHVEVLQLQAGLASSRGEYTKAEKLLRQARVTYQNPLLDFSLARVFYLQKKYRSVLEITQKLMIQLPGSWEVVYLHALSLARLRRWNEALQVSQPFLVRTESQGFAHRLVGDLHRYQGEEELAQQVYKLGLENHPDQLYLIESLSASLAITGNWLEMSELLDTALEKSDSLKGNPALKLVLLDRLALALQQLGKRERGQQVLREFHQMNDPMTAARMFSLEEQLLFPLSLGRMNQDQLFIPASGTIEEQR